MKRPLCPTSRLTKRQLHRGEPGFPGALGYTRAEVIGRNFGEFLAPEWRDHFKENFPRFKAVGEILGVEFEMVKKDGSRILVSFNGKIAYDRNGRFQQTHCIFTDITERRRTEAALVESDGTVEGGAENRPDWTVGTGFDHQHARLVGQHLRAF